MKILPFLLLPFLSFSQDFIISGTAYMYQDGEWVEMPIENILAAAPGDTGIYQGRVTDEIWTPSGTGLVWDALYVGDVNINDPANEIHYIYVVTSDLLKPYIDYGAAESVRDMRRKEIKDNDGNTPGPRAVKVVNFLARKGWEYVEMIAADTYLFKRKN